MLVVQVVHSADPHRFDISGLIMLKYNHIWSASRAYHHSLIAFSSRLRRGIYFLSDRGHAQSGSLFASPGCPIAGKVRELTKPLRLAPTSPYSTALRVASESAGREGKKLQLETSRGVTESNLRAGVSLLVSGPPHTHTLHW